MQMVDSVRARVRVCNAIHTQSASHTHTDTC